MRRTGLVLSLLVALVIMPTRLMAQSLDELTQQGNAAWSAKNYTESENIWKKAVLLYPNDARSYYGLGFMLAEQKKLEEAIVAYHQAIKLQPDLAPAYNNLGNALSDQNKLEEAITAYRQAIKLQPNLAPPYNNLGNALSDQNKLEEAIDAYRQAIKLQPNLAPAYNNLGNALFDLGKKEEAISAYQKAIKLDFTLGQAYIGVGAALDDLREKDAIAAYQKAIEISPKFAADYSDLGNVINDLGKKEEAISAYQKAIELDPKDFYAHNGLGFVYRRQGKLKEALAEYEAALKIDPKSEYAKNNRDAVLALLKQPTELAYTDTNYLRLDDPLTRPKRSVVLLTPLFPWGYGKEGTGFIIKRTSNKLWIITNRHIVVEKSDVDKKDGRTCDSVEVQLYLGGKPSNARVKTLQSKNIKPTKKPEPDLALIEVEVPNLPDDIQALSPAIPQDNQKITTIGHPDGNPWQSDQGKVADVSDQQLLLIISFAVGSSGSPVMDENYGVVGIITNVGDKTGYAIPISQITKQIATWGIKLP